jgi:TonB family protein
MDIRTLTLAFLLATPFICSAQTKETKYYRSRPFTEEVAPEKAKYAVTTETDNGVVITTTAELKKQKVEYSSTYRGKEPWGVWIIGTGKGAEKLDFNFELIYADKTCENAITTFFLDSPETAYTAPIVDGYESYVSFIGRNLRYPSPARRNGIQGAVYLAFTITAQGEIKDVIITKGVDVNLDKEAMRLLRKVKFSAPPKVNGQPQEICVKMPLKFKLE